jgi:eukaryotic-like serine/threonine-protein kinase
MTEDEVPGTVIDRYKLVEQIGEGGFGVVYLAEQQEPVRRQVALKIIKLGMDTRQVIARFEAERQALALMDHPNIAKVLDAGAKSEIRNQRNPDGSPLLCHGVGSGHPITEFCEENRLSIKDRLELFLPVCHAIQHAHQKGVIHRDIKPSNVLVTLDNGVPHPMVIDFGVAKAIHQRLTEKTLHTRFAQMIGTPAYMSPEQAEMSKQDIDTRTDVYSLGILLYELLTGTTPFPEERLRTASYAEIQRIISEEEPIRPSTAVTRLNGRLRSIALNRRCEPAAFIKLIRGDLDWIVLKAIDKDRNRRYATPNELAADLERHLADEPVTATPPSTVYRITKFARRNRTAVIAGAGIAVTLVLGLSLALLEMARANRERQRADALAQDTLQSQAEIAAINEWLQRDLLSIMDPWAGELSETGPANVTLKEALTRAAANLETRLEDHPETEAGIRLIAGSSLAALGSHEESVRHLRRAHELYLRKLGPTHTNTLIAEERLGLSLATANRMARDPGRIELRDEGWRLARDAHDRRVRLFGVDHPDTIRSALDLGRLYLATGNLGRAEELIAPAAQVVGRRERSSAVTPLEALPLDVRAKSALASLRESQGRFGEARRLFKELLEGFGSSPGPINLGTRWSLAQAHFTGKLAYYAWTWDRDHEKAADLYGRAIETARAKVGYGDPTPLLLYEFCKLRQDQQRFAEAIQIRHERFQGLEQSYGLGHPLVCNDVREVSVLHASTGDWERAVQWQTEQRRRGNADDLSLVSELYKRQIAGRPEETAELRRAFWKLFENQPETAAEFPNAYVMLTLPCPDSERELLLRLASGAVERLQDQKEHGGVTPLLVGLIRGMAAYREDRFAVCVSQLRPILANLHDRGLAALGGLYTAMAHERLGNRTEARQSLTEASRLVDAALRLGDLVPRPTPFRPGQLNATCLIARHEAEESILGRAVSPAVTQETLARARAEWKPLRESLEQAHQAARNRRYSDARDLYLQVMADDRFDLDSARHAIAAFDAQVAVVFALAGDRESYQRVWSGLTAANLRYSIPRAACLFPEALPPCRVELWREDMQEPLSPGDPESAGETARGDWGRLDRGVVELRMNRPEQAFEAFLRASQSQAWLCSVQAKAFGALAAHQLGRTTQALAWFNEAEKAWQEMLTHGEGRLNPSFHDQGMIELALNEARPRLATVPRVSPHSP